MNDRDTVVVNAFRKIGMPGDYGTLSTTATTQGALALNSLCSHFNAIHGMPLWNTRIIEVPLSDYTSTTQKLIIGDHAGLTNIPGFDTGPGPLGAPIKILEAWLGTKTLNDSDSSVKDVNRTPLQIYEWSKWNNLPSLGLVGKPQRVSVQLTVGAPEIEGSYGYFVRLDPKPDAYWQAATTNAYLYLSCVYEFKEMTAGTDFPDFPKHWEDAITYTLAERLCPEYGVDIAKWREIRGIAKELVNQSLEIDNEVGSIYINPSRMFNA